MIQRAGSNKPKKALPLTLPLDNCYRYRPLLDKSSFEEEFQHTDGQLAHYFEDDIAEQYRNFKQSTLIMGVGIWTVSLGIAVFSHKIRVLSRLLGEKSWGMFSFKLSSLLIPYFAIEAITPEAEQEEINFLWNKTKDRYRNYKNSGDILDLNPRIQLTGLGLQQNSSLSISLNDKRQQY